MLNFCGICWSLPVKDVSRTSLATDRGNDTDQSEGNGVTPPACRSENVKILPFEFKVLEVCLEYTCKCLETEVYRHGLYLLHKISKVLLQI
jgi:hypothetical protein